MFPATKWGHGAGRTPLISAAMCRSFKVVDVLLKAGADPNKFDSNGSTALIHALRSKDTTTIDKLCACTTVKREESFLAIGFYRINISEPLQRFITNGLWKTGWHIVLKSIYLCLKKKIDNFI